MKIRKISFSLIWGFLICQMTSLALVLSLFVFTPISWIPKAQLIWGMACSIGLIAFIRLRTKFKKLGVIGGAMTVVLFYVCVVSTPHLGRLLGDKIKEAGGVPNSGTLHRTLTTP